MADFTRSVKPGSEQEYRIRSKAQRMSEQAEMMLELRDQIRAYLDNPTDTNKYELISDLCQTLAVLTEDNKKLARELEADITEMRKKLDNLNK